MKRSVDTLLEMIDCHESGKPIKDLKEIDMSPRYSPNVIEHPTPTTYVWNMGHGYSNSNMKLRPAYAGAMEKK